MAPSKFCVHCGAECRFGARFCCKCGRHMKAAISGISFQETIQEFPQSEDPNLLTNCIDRDSTDDAGLITESSDKLPKPLSHPSFWVAMLALVLATAATAIGNYVGLSRVTSQSTPQTTGFGFFSNGVSTCNDFGNFSEARDTDDGDDDDDMLGSETGELVRKSESIACSASGIPVDLQCAIICSNSYKCTTIRERYQTSGFLKLIPADSTPDCACYTGSSGDFLDPDQPFPVNYQDRTAQITSMIGSSEVIVQVNVDNSNDCLLTYQVSSGKVLGMSPWNGEGTPSHTAVQVRPVRRSSERFSDNTCKSSLQARCYTGEVCSILVSVTIGIALIAAILRPGFRVWFNAAMLSAAYFSTSVWATVITLTQGKRTGALCAPLGVGGDADLQYQASFGCMIATTCLCVISVFLP
eukprot:m.153184 g.153184  ORF g.153184 m.153184 type:complete len:412 (-) comp17908_c0_seq1:646-1881(-)